MTALKLRKLVIFLSESCNLACSYCYVVPNRDLKKRPLSQRKLVHHISKILDNYSEVELVQFFGGEPTLRPRLMQLITDEVHARVSDGRLKKVPRFGMVTNGNWNGRAEILDFILGERIEVTISLDGPQEIHDCVRPLKRGGGSHAAAVSAAGKLQKAGHPFSIEGVFTRQHILQGFRAKEILEYAEQIGAAKCYVDPAFPPAPRRLVPFEDDTYAALVENMIELIDYWMYRYLHDRSYNLATSYLDILAAILSGRAGRPVGSCPADVGDLAIDSSGGLYPCSLFFGIPGFREEEEIAMARRKSGKKHEMFEISHSSCNACPARHWCRTCPAMNANWGDISNVAEKECSFNFAVVSHIMKRAAKSLPVPVNEITTPLLNYS